MLVENSYIDLKKTAESGQCFRWKELDNGAWEVPVSRYVAQFRRINDTHIEISSDLNDEAFWSTYLGLDRDYEHMFSALTESAAENDKLVRSYEFSRGITILNQPFFETCISFLISQNNNIPRIKGIIAKICDSVHGQFPDAEKLSVLLKEDDFGLGYRKPYIELFCRSWIEGKLDDLSDIAPLSNVSSDNIRKEAPPLSDVMCELQAFQGIGPKVAACIALFSLGYIECVPRDVWIKRAEEQYDINWNTEYAGFQQQLVFFWQTQGNKA